jgi:hypothetical protein
MTTMSIDIFKRSELSKKHKGMPFSHDLCAVSCYQLTIKVTPKMLRDPLQALGAILPIARDHAGSGSFRAGIFEIQTDAGIFNTKDGNRLDLDRPEQIQFWDWDTDQPIELWTLKATTKKTTKAKPFPANLSTETKDMPGDPIPPSVPAKLAALVQNWDDERGLGNSLIVTLKPGMAFEPSATDGCHVWGFDNVKDAIKGLRQAEPCSCTSICTHPTAKN